MKPLTLGQQTALGLAVTLTILGAFGALGYTHVQRMIGLNRLAARADERLTELSQLLSALDEAESRKSGLLITGKEELREPYRQSKEKVERKATLLPGLYADDAAQRAQVERLLPLARERLGELDATLEARRVGGAAAAAGVEFETRARQTMERIRSLVDEVRKRERSERAERRAGIEETAMGLGRTTFVGAVAVVLLIGVLSRLSTTRLARRLGVAVRQVQSASTELETSAGQQVKGAKAQVSVATEVSATMRELVFTSRQIAESAQQVTSAANETAAAAEGGTLTVASAQQAVEAVRGQVDRIVDHMLDLGKRSQEIGGILDIINELAEQTNILAINATIEAVGAGEAGRRFGVVAGEIRKLADRVGGSTKEIRRLIEEIRAASNTTVMATEDGARAAEAGTRKFAEVTQSFQRIADLVGGTAQAARAIVITTKQQTSAMEQVSVAVAEVAQTARESESGAAQTVSTAAELAVLSRELDAVVSRRALRADARS